MMMMQDAANNDDGDTDDGDADDGEDAANNDDNADTEGDAANNDDGAHDGAVLGSAPSVMWSVVAGRVCYRLPGHTAYAVGSSKLPQVPELRQLRGDTWGVLMGAFPQVIAAGEPTDGDVLVEIHCVERTAVVASPPASTVSTGAGA